MSQNNVAADLKVGDVVKIVMKGSKKNGLYGVVQKIRSKSQWPYKVLIDGQSIPNGFKESQLEFVRSASGSIMAVPKKPKNNKKLVPPKLPGRPLMTMTKSNPPWNWAQGWDTLADALKGNTTESHADTSLSSRKLCHCGSWKTYGENIPDDHHSEWCPIFKAHMETEAMMKALEKK